MLGRFLQTDPVGYQSDLNLYAYVLNDPLNHSDPTGRFCDAPGTFCHPDSVRAAERHEPLRTVNGHGSDQQQRPAPALLRGVVGRYHEALESPAAKLAGAAAGHLAQHPAEAGATAAGQPELAPVAGQLAHATSEAVGEHAVAVAQVAGSTAVGEAQHAGGVMAQGLIDLERTGNVLNLPERDFTPRSYDPDE